MASPRPPERGKQQRRRPASAPLSSRGWFGWRAKQEAREARREKERKDVQPFGLLLAVLKETPMLFREAEKKIIGAAIRDKSAERLQPRRPDCIRWERESRWSMDRVRTQPA
jgi:hypothetical protein